MKRLTFAYTLVAAATLGATAAGAAEMRVFKQPNFSGDGLVIHGNAANLADANFQDQISSIEVRSGSWQLCTQPNFRGDCVVIGRGDYPSLEQVLNHRIESVRQLPRYAAKYGEDRTRYAYRGDYYTDNHWDRNRADLRPYGR
jgi:hypothetical protein